MLNKVITWSYLLIKRFLRNPVFACSLIFIVLFAMILKTGSKDESIITIGLTVEDSRNNTLANEIVNNLYKKNDHSVSYTIYDNKDKLKEAVLENKVISGFVFEKNFKKHLSEYTNLLFGSNDMDNDVISVYTLDINKDSSFAIISNESVYDAIYEEVAKEVLVSFVNSKHTLTEKDINELKTIRGEKDLDHNFFTFTYLNHTGTTGTDLSKNNTFLIIPLKGIILTLILLSSMCGGILIFHDKTSGFFTRIPLRKHIFINYIYCLIPAILSSIVGIISLYLAGVPFNGTLELIRYILYGPICAVVVIMLVKLTKNIVNYSTIIPFYLICNLILNPVFIDITSNFPYVEYIRLILPVHYGL